MVTCFSLPWLTGFNRLTKVEQGNTITDYDRRDSTSLRSRSRKAGHMVRAVFRPEMDVPEARSRATRSCSPAPRRAHPLSEGAAAAAPSELNLRNVTDVFRLTLANRFQPVNQGRTGKHDHRLRSKRFHLAQITVEEGRPHG